MALASSVSPARLLAGAALLAGLAGLLCGCSPTYDWREVRGAGALVMFPGKPASVTREVELAGLRVSMTMQSARADGLGFAFARVDLPADQADLHNRARIVAALRAGLLRNLSGTSQAGAAGEAAADAASPAAKPYPLARSDRAAAPVSASLLEVTGQSEGQELALRALLGSVDTRVYQIAVYGPRAAMDTPAGREAIDTFFSSIRLD